MWQMHQANFQPVLCYLQAGDLGGMFVGVQTALAQQIGIDGIFPLEQRKIGQAQGDGTMAGDIPVQRHAVVVGAGAGNGHAADVLQTDGHARDGQLWIAGMLDADGEGVLATDERQGTAGLLARLGVVWCFFFSCHGDRDLHDACRASGDRCRRRAASRGAVAGMTGAADALAGLSPAR